jgi:hypothetical protein
MDLRTLKANITSHEVEDFVREFVLAGPCLHVDQKAIDYIRDNLSRAVRIQIEPGELFIVGSAKLGFGLFEKKRKDSETLPRFRAFGAASDIDVAICSARLFDSVWKELCDYASAKPWFPYKMNNTGNYLVYGWLRPDQVPREARLRTLDSFQDCMRSLSNSLALGRREINGAIYRDVSFLSKYQIRGIAKCREELLANEDFCN